jgi:hypothetical protein
MDATNSANGYSLVRLVDTDTIICTAIPATGDATLPGAVLA